MAYNYEKFGFHPVSKETYDEQRGDRVKADAVMVGSLCTLRQITPGIKDGFAVDANVRVTTLSKPGERGLRFIEMVVVDPDGRDLVHEGRSLYCESVLGTDGILYEHDGVTEDGYLPGATDPWNMSNLENLVAAEVPVTVDLSRQLVTV